MPNFDSTISLGNILTVVGFVAAFWAAATKVYNSLDRRLISFEALLLGHAQTLVSHGAKMEKQDEILLRLVGDMQRLIGRVEGSHQNMERAESVARELIATAAQTAKDTLTAAQVSARPIRISDVRANEG